MTDSAEEEPLLGQDIEQSDDQATKCAANDHPEPETFRQTSTLWSLSILFALVFVTNFSVYLIEIPLIRLLERSICLQHLTSSPTDLKTPTDIDEEQCKVPVIQDKLAFVLGLRVAFDALPGLDFILVRAYFGLLTI
jgi:hypothetical protein